MYFPFFLLAYTLLFYHIFLKKSRFQIFLIDKKEKKRYDNIEKDKEKRI